MPLLYSHGCARTLNDHRRCSSDHILEKIAKSGGGFCITSVPGFLSSKPPGEVTIEDMVNHIDYAVKIMGIDHVGLGADYPMYFSHQQLAVYATWVNDLEKVEQWPNLTEALVRRGYEKTEIEKIMGGNLENMFESVVG